MTHDNVLRNRYAADTTRTRIHLVHSYSGHLDRRSRAVARPQLVLTIPQHVAPQVRSRRRTDTVALAIAAGTAPLLWAGHAILHFMHLV